ncbi:MAG: SigB/SigF/SigG family RNA polymerase sigma factor [Thermoleophilia bacterium]|nr:SigB/SigF/SigG family RNA polymerase sigma factor [Thermoleophilia bacterium]
MPPPNRPLSAEERERLVMEHLPLVRGLARRYADRGEPLDDLVQVGTIGLIKAVDRFDPSRGNKLASFATPTILGEIRRHFRDRSWTVRVPRGIQEARAEIAKAVDDLSARLGRSPSVREIAESADLSVDEVLDALAAGSAQRPAPLASPGGEGEDDPGIAVGVEERGFERAEARAALDPALATLPPRERVILHLRFEEGMTQSQIAARIGISQMHVSRLIRRALEALRERAGGE